MTVEKKDSRGQSKGTATAVVDAAIVWRLAGYRDEQSAVSALMSAVDAYLRKRRKVKR